MPCRNPAGSLAAVRLSRKSSASSLMRAGDARRKHRRMQSSDLTRTAAKVTAAAVLIVAIAFGLWRVRSIVILLLLALTFAAAIRPGVEWLRRRHVPQSLAIFFFFALVLGTLGLFFWLAVPPALHQLSQALHEQQSGTVPLTRTGSGTAPSRGSTASSTSFPTVRSSSTPLP